MSMTKGGHGVPFLSFHGLRLVQVALLLLFPWLHLAHSKCILFNFGDSNSDTGGYVAGTGFYLGPPFGRQFFRRTTGRFSDGRLYIDFLCEELKINFLSHYLESSGSNFTTGANFAVAGAATNTTRPFPLATQVLLFLHFKNRTRELRPIGSGSLISEKELGHAVHTIDIGQNDLTMAFFQNLSYSEIVHKIPIILSSIRSAVELIYENGGKKFMIYNTGPFGCLPQTLALRKEDNSELDAAGCLAVYNNVAKAFNSELSNLCNKMRSEFKSATIVLVDMYNIKYDLIANHTRYGFPTPLMACCGHGGPPYNYRSMTPCGQPEASSCPEGSRYVSWDGVHYTEAANSIIASKILSATYSTPSIKLKTLCKS